MVQKEFLSYQTIRNNSLKLAHRIHRDGFVPDVIYVSLRGGAYMANVISEYFKVVRKGERPVFFAAVVARSYTDVQAHEAIRIDGWTYSPEYLRSGDRILLIDDIYDSGKTVNHLVGVLLDKGIPRQDIKVAVHDYKVRSWQGHGSIAPDYWCRKHELTSPQEDTWVHYLSHELIGLSDEEIRRNYAEDPEVVDILLEINRKR